MNKLTNKIKKANKLTLFLGVVLIIVAAWLSVAALKNNNPAPASDTAIGHKATTSPYTDPSFVEYKDAVENCAKYGGPAPSDSVIYDNWKNKQPIGC